MTTQTDNSSNFDNFKENDPEIEPTKEGMKSLRERIRQTKTTRWIRFAIVSVIFFLWVIWMGNPWLGLFWLLLLDIYITAYIPWTWWKKKGEPVQTLMAWVDAMVYALVLVYFIFTFVGQNYKIPSSSLEKSLLVGDYLWVNKMVYGARVPQTPLHFPLAQHTVPFLNVKSYLDNPQLEYHRLPGIREIRRGDIVVFNYPQGDSISPVYEPENVDYYQIKDELRRHGVQDPRKYMDEHPEFFGEIKWRPVDRRENFVKRCLGLPGDRLAIKGDTVFINGEPIADPDNVQFNYVIPVSGKISRDKWMSIGVRLDDSGYDPNGPELTGYKFYDVPLTAEMKRVVESWPEVNGPLIREGLTDVFMNSGVFPTEADYGWTRQNMGELWIPKRGSTLHLTLDNLPIYKRAISVYEGNDLKVKNGKIYINGEQTDYYTFKMDYYWMMGDNRDRSADSRYWGFVPEDHIVGSPMFVIVSLDEERGLFNGKIRWDRILKGANPDEKW